MNISKYNFSTSDWDNTPEAVKHEFIRLEQRINELEEKLNQILVRLNKDSSNSSKPPSSDSPYKKKPDPKKTTARKRGGQLGHKGKRQPLLAPTEEVSVMPETCRCGNKLFTKTEHYYTHQEIELPDIPLDVVHYNLFKGYCANCDNVVKAPIPKEHCTGFGPRLSALIADLSGIQGNSRRMVQDFCQSGGFFRR